MFKKSKNLLQPKFLKYFHLFMNDVDFVFRSLSKFSPATAFSISFTTFSMKIFYLIISLVFNIQWSSSWSVSELYRFVCCERETRISREECGLLWQSLQQLLVTLTPHISLSSSLHYSATHCDHLQNTVSLPGPPSL